MYLSLLELNPRSKQVQAELRDPYQMHRTLSKAFGDDKKAYNDARLLFRLDEFKDGSVLKVITQSQSEPDWKRLTIQSDYFLEAPLIKNYEVKLKNGQILRFRLLANPTVKKDGKRIGIGKEEEQLKWLDRKAENGGFVVLSASVKPSKILVSSASENTKAVFLSALFDGFLRVTDPNKFIDTLSSGIGSAKGFGFGLLSIGHPK